MLTIDLVVNISYHSVTMVKEFFSTTEAAELLGVSRIAVFKKIKSGDIKARKIGRNFVIDKREIPEILGTLLSKGRKAEIEKAVKKTVHQYRETLRLLGQE